VSSLATIEVIKEEKLLENATKVGEYLGRRLKELQDQYPGLDNARGIGLMRAIEFVRDKESKLRDQKTRDRVIEKSYKNGLILLPCGSSAIRFIPPLIIQKDQMEAAMDVFAETVAEVMSTKEPTKVKPKDEDGKIVLPPFKPHNDIVEGTDKPRTEGLKGTAPKKAGKKKK
jgi:4-aminobutyrate aminotransferase